MLYPSPDFALFVSILPLQYSFRVHSLFLKAKQLKRATDYKTIAFILFILARTRYFEKLFSAVSMTL
jgi:O-methyltransferase involved in polyketide biosynthesis